MTDGLTEVEVRGRVISDLNPVAWILWHVGRAEDVALNRLVTDGEQVLAGRWTERLGIQERSGGTGMTPEEADALAAGIELGGLWEYLDAVHRRTVTLLETLDPRPNRPVDLEIGLRELTAR